MCDPISAATMAWISASTAAAGTIVSSVTASTQAKQQAAYQAQAAEAEKSRASQEAYQLRQKQSQEKEALARDSQRITKQSREAISTAKVSAGEAGMTGQSVDALLADYQRQELSYLEATQRQSQIIDTSYDTAVDSAMKQSGYNLVSINKPISQPSFLEIPIGLGNAAVTGANTYKSLKIQ